MKQDKYFFTFELFLSSLSSLNVNIIFPLLSNQNYAIINSSNSRACNKIIGDFYHIFSFLFSTTFEVISWIFTFEKIWFLWFSFFENLISLLWLFIFLRPIDDFCIIIKSSILMNFNLMFSGFTNKINHTNRLSFVVENISNIFQLSSI